MNSSEYPGRDRRKSQRLRVRLAVVYQINKPLNVRMQIGDKELIATTLDLSEGGIAISTNYDIPLQTDLLIKLTLFKVDNENKVTFYGPMEIIGEVRSNSLLENGEHRLGISFTSIEEKDLTELVKFLNAALIKLQ
jgi:c-di-GMP-binding flagellar brake protein YcgR